MIGRRRGRTDEPAVEIDEAEEPGVTEDIDVCSAESLEGDLAALAVRYGPGADGSLWKSHGILGDPALIFPTPEEKAAWESSAHPERHGLLPHSAHLIDDTPETFPPYDPTEAF